MNTKTMITIFVAALAVGCSEECEATIYEDGGATWGSLCDWDMSAQLATQDEIGDAIEAGVIEHDGECYASTQSDAHVCVIDVDGLPLLARPVDELGAVIKQPCAGSMWPTVMHEGGSECLAVIGDYAVRVRL